MTKFLDRKIHIRAVFDTLMSIIFFGFMASFIMFFFSPYSNIKFESAIALAAIIFAILIFVINRIIDKNNHEKNQLNLIKNIVSELDIISKNRELCCINIDGHVEWYKQEIKNKNLPLHPIKELNTDAYIIGLDYSIKYEQTYKLKQLLQLINDKIFLINSMTKKGIDIYYTNFTLIRKIKDTDNSKLDVKDKKCYDDELKPLINDIITKINKIIPDLELLICCAREEIKIKWGIDSICKSSSS